MNFLANLIALIIEKLLSRLGLKLKKSVKDAGEIKEEGARAEEAAEEAVSELQKPEPVVDQTKPAPEVPSVQKWSTFFKHRRNRKRP
jgi:hypothetical protein